MVFESTLEEFELNKVYNLHIPIPGAIAEEFVNGKDRRVICEIDGVKKWHAGLMPYASGYYILMSQKRVSDLGLKRGDKVVLKLEKDESEYGMHMPEELQVLLDQDEQGSRYFHDLTPGKQRNLIYIVNQVKNPESRLSKALAIVTHLNEERGNLDFKKLNAKIKAYNQMRKLKS
ncbi:MAG: YdeI/OmpD-associated family protein [Cyclobacteriaceae bacterium]